MLEGNRRHRSQRAESSAVDMVLAYSAVASLQQPKKATGAGAVTMQPVQTAAAEGQTTKIRSGQGADGDSAGPGPHGVANRAANNQDLEGVRYRDLRPARITPGPILAPRWPTPGTATGIPFSPTSWTAASQQGIRSGLRTDHRWGALAQRARTGGCQLRFRHCYRLFRACSLIGYLGT